LLLIPATGSSEVNIPAGLTQDQTFLLTALTVTVSAVVVAMICATIVISIVFWRTKDNAATSFVSLAQNANILQLATVLVILAAVYCLRTLDDISAEAATTVLSGIAGYVLGGIAGSKPKRRVEEPQSAAASLDR